MKKKEYSLDDALDAIQPIVDNDDIDWENLTWEPKPADQIVAQKKQQAVEYQQFLQDRIANRKKKHAQKRRAMLDSKKKVTSSTRRHPDMLDGNHPLDGLKPKPGKELKLFSVRRAEEWWVKESRKNIAAYMRYVWGLQPADHHLMWFKQMLSPGNSKTIIVGPRGSAKSTIALVFISWYMGKFPHLANVLISVTLKQAQDRLETIRDFIEHNERYKKVFPHIVLDKKRPNNKTTLNIKSTALGYGAWRNLVRSRSDAKAPSLFASGVGGSQVIGSRCTGILLLDDLMDERNIATEELREKLWTWVSQTLMPILTKTARVVHITTRWHSDDLVVRQIATGEWTHTYTRALWRDKKGQVRSYWPDQFSLKRLASIRKLIGSAIFKIMYLCIPTALQGMLFDIDMLRNGLPEELPPFQYVFLSIDPALKAKQQADDTVISVIGVPRSKDEMYVLEMHVGKWRPETTAARISSVWAAVWDKYGMEPHVVMETIGGMEIFEVLLRKIGVVNMSKFNTFTPNIDKYTRAVPLGSLAELGGLFFNLEDRFYNKAVSQLLEFTGDPGNPDDIVDTLSMIAGRIRGSAKAALRQATTKKFIVPGAY
jgi:predicted phage terminase large subunit-like protein